MSLFKSSRNRKRLLLVAGCSILLGLVLLTAGMGKVLGQAEFTHALRGMIFSPVIVNIIVHFVPWLEIGLGLLLILGIFPQIISAVCIGLISGFIVSNIWGLLKAQTAITCGDCFGVWESLLGWSLTPLQALLIDVVLLCLALIILTQTPARFPLFGFWRGTKTNK